MGVIRFLFQCMCGVVLFTGLVVVDAGMLWLLRIVLYWLWDLDIKDLKEGKDDSKKTKAL